MDLDNNKVVCAEELPELPEVEGRQLRKSLLQLVHPTLARLDLLHSTNTFLRRFSKPWCKDHDVELRYVFEQNKLCELLDAIYEYIGSEVKFLLMATPVLLRCFVGGMFYYIMFLLHLTLTGCFPG